MNRQRSRNLARTIRRAATELSVAVPTTPVLD